MASRPGLQPCPHCGAGVDVDAPPGTPPATGEPPGPRPAPVGPATPPTWSQPQPHHPAHPAGLPTLVIPEPATVGFLTTLKFVLGAPRRFFDALGPQSPIRTGVRFGYVASLVGILGTAIKGWLAEPVPLPVESLASLPEAARQCAINQQTAWDAAVEPLLLARMPLAPVLALMLVYGITMLFHTLARAMGNSTTELPLAARNLGYAFAPLALAALPFMAFGGCFLWSLVLMGISLKRTYGLTTGLAALMAAFPFCLWMAVELLVAMYLLIPCLPTM
ncbi:MAG: YIP1 family protein [Myxococcota bacterium]